MSEFYDDSDAPLTTTNNVMPLAALIKRSVTYMSSSGPGSCRSFEIPAYDLEISEEWKIDSFKSNKIKNNNQEIYLSKPNQVFELQDVHISDLDALIAAKRTFEAAIAAYEAAQAAFRKSTTGKWIDDLLVPDKPLPETLEARVPHGEISKLIDLVKSYSINPIEEEVKIVPTFSGYNSVTIILNLKFGIHLYYFSNLYSKLQNFSEISSKDRIVVSQNHIRVTYGDGYSPYRKTDLTELEENETNIKKIIMNKGKRNTEKDNFIIPNIVSKGTSEEDHADYMEEQMRVLESVSTYSKTKY
jgi:hypothetical protein